MSLASRKYCVESLLRRLNAKLLLRSFTAKIATLPAYLWTNIAGVCVQKKSPESCLKLSGPHKLHSPMLPYAFWGLNCAQLGLLQLPFLAWLLMSQVTLLSFNVCIQRL